MTLRPFFSSSKGQSGEDIFPSPRLPCGNGEGDSSVALTSSRLGQLHPNNRVNSSVLQLGVLSVYFLKKFNDREHSNRVFPHIVSLKKFYSFWVKNILRLFLNFSHLFSRLIFWNKLCSRWRNENWGDHSLEEASLFTMACNFCLTTLSLNRLTIDY